MTKVVAVPLVVVALVVAALGTLSVARHVGGTSGTPGTAAAPGEACPMTTPSACTNLISERFGLDAAELPVIAAVPVGLTYVGGRVETAPNGREVADFKFQAIALPHYLYEVGLVRMAPPVHDTSRVEATPQGRKYRAVTETPLGLKFVFYGPRVAVAVGAFAERAAGTRRGVEALLDAVRLDAQQVDP